jgi:hypothetical protein
MFKNLEEFQEKVQNKLKMDPEQYDHFVENQFKPQEREEEETPAYTDDDMTNECLNIVMKETTNNIIPKNFKKWEETLKVSGKVDMKDVEDFKCINHPKRKVCYVCLNSNCKLIFFCQGCLKNHNDVCDRENMIVNNKRILEKDYVEEYYDYDEFDFDNKIDQVKDEFAKVKEEINNSLNVLEKISIDKIIFYSKEFKMRRIRDIIVEDLKEFEDTPSHKNYYKVGYGNFKFQKLNEFEKIKNCDEELKEVNNLVAQFKKNLANDISKFKKDCMKLSKKAIQELQKEAMQCFNVEMINPKVNINNVVPLKFDNRGLLNVATVNPKNTTKLTPPPAQENNSSEDNNSSEENNPSEKINIDESVFSGIISNSKNSFTKAEILPILKAINTKISSVKLSYRLSSSKGFSASEFHKKCDSVSPSILLCETADKQKFGVYNSVVWGEEGENQKTDKNFIYSISKNTMHRLKINKKSNSRLSDGAISFEEDSGPIVGDDDIVIGANCSQKEECTSTLGNSYEFNQKGDPETYLAGKKEFKLKSLYVFELK